MRAAPGRLTAALAVALAVTANASAAISQQTNTAEEITIIGKAPPELRREVSDYIQRLGIVLGQRPASRWVDPVCPQAVGLDPAQAARVEAQVRSVAQAVGARLAKPGCQGNLVIAFTQDAGALVSEISKRQPLVHLATDQRKELLTGSAPIRWWYSSEVRGADGLPAEAAVLSPAFRTQGTNLGPGVQNIANDAAPMNDRTGVTSGRTASLIATATMRAIRHATIVVDSRHVQGTALPSLVDYAALVGLAEIRPGAAAPGSILSLFGSGQPDRLSKNDMALLEGLYALQLTRRAEQHRRSLVTNILKQRLDPRNDSAN